MVEVEADLVGVEGNCTVNVGDRDGDKLQLHVHGSARTPSMGHQNRIEGIDGESRSRIHSPPVVLEKAVDETSGVLMGAGWFYLVTIQAGWRSHS